MVLAYAIGTLGAGSIAALAGGAAIAGAVGLGIAGLAAKYHAGRRHGHYRGYRGKREVKDQKAAVQNLLQVIREEDATGCGLKLVCELAGVRDDQLMEEEQAILSLVGAVARPGEGLLPPGGAGDYVAAKDFGQQLGNCTQAFPLCPPKGTELMGAVLHYLP